MTEKMQCRALPDAETPQPHQCAALVVVLVGHKLLGDVLAVSKRPRAKEKRLMRRAAGRGTGRMLGRWFR